MKILSLLLLLFCVSVSLAACKKTTNTVTPHYQNDHVVNANDDDEEIAECDSTGDDSDCPDGEICVGIGICVPEAEGVTTQGTLWSR